MRRERMPFPIHRMRRLRSSAKLRELVRETDLLPRNLVLPLFVCPGSGVSAPIDSLPGHDHLSADKLVEKCREAEGLGLGGVLLFGIPESKDEVGSGAYAEGGVVQTAVRALKEAGLSLPVITDVCLCEYTSHGHCGNIVDGDVDNDTTLELLARTAVSHAAAGADMVAPSDMMDGRVAAIREALDGEGHEDVPIMSYAAKQASVFYGPFREAAGSAPSFGDRKSYQMDPANADEAMREMELDLEEGADILMVKPALPCLDIIREAAAAFPVPIAAYNVSGEYAMVHAAAEKDWLNLDGAMLESLTAIRRAGARIIMTYFALDAARALSARS
jgi:porphobilinogen synthase